MARTSCTTLSAVMPSRRSVSSPGAEAPKRSTATCRRAYRDQPSETPASTETVGRSDGSTVAR